jgi:putative spermidine/putrescine transport system ATP-binding protein
MVFQSYALFPHMTVAKNVAFGLELLGLKRAEIDARVTEALRMMRLADFAKRLPWQLSGGQQQRLAFARAVVLEPRLLLLDEPLSNLDAKLREELKGEIKRLHERLKITTVHVTHDQGEAMSLSDLVVVMRGGRIEQAGAPEDIYQRPATLFVADFMGYRNRFPVEVLQADGRGARLVGPGIDLLATGEGASGLRPGARAVACFRPDDVVALADGLDIAPAGSNQLSACISLVEYLGRSYAAEAALAGGPTLHLQHGQPLHNGQPVRVSVPAERVMVYAAE